MIECLGQHQDLVFLLFDSVIISNIWSIIDIAIIDIARCKIITFIVYRYSDNVSRKICTMERVKWFRNSSDSIVFIQLFLFCKKISFSMTFEAFYDVRTLFMFYDNK